jgi:Holliday junction resolvase RusA-like endonuclease
MQAVFYWPDKRRRDDDNASASLKAYRDGVADAGLVSDDSSIRALPAVLDMDKQNPRVQITLTRTG